MYCFAFLLALLWLISEAGSKKVFHGPSMAAHAKKVDNSKARAGFNVCVVIVF